MIIPVRSKDSNFSGFNGILHRMCERSWLTFGDSFVTGDPPFCSGAGTPTPFAISIARSPSTLLNMSTIAFLIFLSLTFPISKMECFYNVLFLWLRHAVPEQFGLAEKVL